MKQCICGPNWTDEFCHRHGSKAGQCPKCDRLKREISELKERHDASKVFLFDGLTVPAEIGCQINGTVVRYIHRDAYEFIVKQLDQLKRPS